MNESAMTMPSLQKSITKPSVWKNIFAFFPDKDDTLAFWQTKSKLVLFAAIFYSLGRLWLDYPLMFTTKSSVWLPWLVSEGVILILHTTLVGSTLRYTYKTKNAPLLFLQTIILTSLVLLVFNSLGSIDMGRLKPLADMANFGLLALVFLISKHAQTSLRAAATISNLQKNNATTQARQWVAENKTNRVDAKTLGAGDRIIVLSGEIIPRDGIIISGDTSVDESAITRTAIPLHKTKGDAVFGGTLNRDSEIQIEIQGPHNQDLLSVLTTQTLGLIDENTPANRFLKTISQILPFVFLIIALGTGLFVFHFLNADFERSYLATCAILFSVPFTLPFVQNVRTAAIGGLWHRGIVLKKATLLEKLGKLKTIFFNKTGILTTGEFVYSQEIIESGNSLGEFLGVIFSLEAGVDHPLAKAVMQHPWYNEIPQAKILSRTVYPGLGISGTLQAPDQSRFQAYVGNLRFMKRHQCQISRELKTKIEDLENLGETVILCGFDREVRGIMSFGDTLRRHVTHTLKSIQNAGVATALITGDTEKTVTQILSDKHFSQVHARLTPEEKTAPMLKAQAPSQPVALVTNDFHTSAASPEKITIAIDTGLSIREHPADIVILNSKIENVAALVTAAKSLQQMWQWGVWGSLTIGLGLTALVLACQIHPLISLGASTLWACGLSYKSSSKIVEL